jgi:hypothetical protein
MPRVSPVLRGARAGAPGAVTTFASADFLGYAADGARTAAVILCVCVCVCLFVCGVRLCLRVLV